MVNSMATMGVGRATMGFATVSTPIVESTLSMKCDSRQSTLHYLLDTHALF